MCGGQEHCSDGTEVAPVQEIAVPGTDRKCCVQGSGCDGSVTFRSIHKVWVATSQVGECVAIKDVLGFRVDSINTLRAFIEAILDTSRSFP